MQHGITHVAAYLNLCTAVADCCTADRPAGRQFETEDDHHHLIVHE